MIDRHIYGDTNRISPEAPVPVVLHRGEELALGAAANVASHITTAGMECLFAYKGTDAKCRGENWRRFVNMSAERNILLRPLYTLKETPITIKTRIWSNGQQVCRIDEENVSKPDDETEQIWITCLQDLILHNNPDVVVFSDYNKGTLTNTIIDEIASGCIVPTILDPKRPSFHCLDSVDFIKPNVKEVELTNLTPVECSQKLKSTYLINTLGKDGMAVYQNGELVFECPTEAAEVVDVCGCGDTVTALLAIALAKRYDIHDAVRCANKGASFTIKHKGCYVLTREEIMLCLER